METITATAVHNNNTWHVVVQQNLQKWQTAGKRRRFSPDNLYLVEVGLIWEELRAKNKTKNNELKTLQPSDKVKVKKT